MGPSKTRIVACAALSLPVAASALACATVYRQGEEAFLERERVAIVWQYGKRTQHFIRGASFRGGGKDFGFLVPTPSKPLLAEASDKAFDRLQKHVPIIRTGEPQSSGGLGGGFGGGVTVVQRQSVSGFDAAVLAASNGGALVQWLRENGYMSRPALGPWSQPYLTLGYYMTAFKIAREPGKDAVDTSPVRISFGIDVPFYPYREPRESRPRNLKRGLTIYLVSSTPMEAVLALSQARYPMSAVYARVPEEEREELAKELGLKPSDLPTPMVLTRFGDSTQVRPQDDLQFIPKSD